MASLSFDKAGCVSAIQIEQALCIALNFISFDKAGCVSAIQIEQALCIALNLDLIFG